VFHIDLLSVSNREQTGGHTTHHIDLDLLYLEAQDNGPYQAKNETRVSINNIFCTDTFQSNLNKGTAVSKNCMTWTTLDHVFTFCYFPKLLWEMNQEFMFFNLYIIQSGQQNSPVFKTIVDNVLSEPILPTLSRRPILNTLLFV
jgi:hypothetical protein